MVVKKKTFRESNLVCLRYEKRNFRAHNNECCIGITQELILMFLATFGSSGSIFVQLIVMNQVFTTGNKIKV